MQKRICVPPTKKKMNNGRSGVRSGYWLERKPVSTKKKATVSAPPKPECGMAGDWKSAWKEGYREGLADGRNA